MEIISESFKINILIYLEKMMKNNTREVLKNISNVIFTQASP